MSGLKVYGDPMSQPFRAVLLFIKQNGIKHEEIEVSLLKGEQKADNYIKNVNPHGKVPAINDNGFKLVESVAILRYLARKYDVDDHWYPKDIEGQAKVDEFLEWHHLGLRLAIASYLLPKFILPLLYKLPVNDNQVVEGKKKMEIGLDTMETIWLKDQDFVTGNKITIADLIALCEIDEPRVTGYEPQIGRPKLEAWLNRVRKELHPHYDEVTTVLRRYVKEALMARGPSQ